MISWKFKSTSFLDVFKKFGKYLSARAKVTPAGSYANKHSHTIPIIKKGIVLWWCYRLKTGPVPLTWENTELLKNKAFGKSGSQGLYMLPFVSSHTKYSVEKIHFYVKSRDIQSVTFVQITSEKCTGNLSFGNGEVDIKTTTASCQPLLAWSVSACLRIFVQPRF